MMPSSVAKICKLQYNPFSAHLEHCKEKRNQQIITIMITTIVHTRHCAIVIMVVFADFFSFAMSSKGL